MSSEILRPNSVEVQPFPWKRLPGYQQPAYEAEPKQAERERSRSASQPDEAIQQQIEQARQQGYRQGQTEAAQAAAARVDALMGKLARTIEELATYRPRLRREAEEDVVKLALAIAKRIIGRELSIDPDIILALVKAGIQKLDARDIQRVSAHPEDAARIRSFLEGWNGPVRIEVSADNSLERGAVVFSTSRGALDLSVNTQLAEIERGFTDLIRRGS
jgi:flagellar assembly protein FliH